MAKFEITEEEIAKYKEMKDKTATWWDKNKDKVYVGAIVYFACDQHRIKRFTRKLVKDILPKCFDKIDENFVKLDNQINANTNDIQLLKSFLTKIEK